MSITKRAIAQHVLQQRDNDCLSACLSSLFTVEVKDVPLFAEKGENWYSYYRRWIIEETDLFFGGTLHFPLAPLLVISECFTKNEALVPLQDELFIASGPSPRKEGVDHAVIVNTRGVIVHDPHPSNSGIELVTGVDLITVTRCDHNLTIY